MSVSHLVSRKERSNRDRPTICRQELKQTYSTYLRQCNPFYNHEKWTTIIPSLILSKKTKQQQQSDSSRGFVTKVSVYHEILVSSHNCEQKWAGKKKKSSYSDQSGRASTKLANSRDDNAERKVQRVTFRVAVSAPWPYNMPPSPNLREGGRVPHALARVENTCTWLNSRYTYFFKNDISRDPRWVWGRKGGG